MIIWTIKLFNSVRHAVAGRKYPHQLAWAVAFGFLLGVVPHGNLLALGLLILILSLKLNHAMAGLTTIGTTFAATWLDPYSHQIGDRILTDPQVAGIALRAWQLPLVPWTDLNNTVVMGSFLIGVGALVPIFVVTYPVFRLIAPAADPEPTSSKENVKEDDSASHQIILVDQSHSAITAPHRSSQPVPAAGGDSSQELGDGTDFNQRLENALSEEPAEEGADSSGGDIAVETRIDVIRMKDYRDPAAQDDSSEPATDSGDQAEPQPMDEALNYLLRQLRDSQQRKVA